MPVIQIPILKIILISFSSKLQELCGVQTMLAALQHIPNNCSNSTGTGYHKVFSSPWAPHIEVEEKHYEISQAITRWARPTSSQTVDHFQLMLLTMIIFLSCDDVTCFDDLQKSKVEKIQLKYILLFHRYLKGVHPKEASAKFIGGLMLLHHSKELQQLHKLRLPF